MTSTKLNTVTNKIFKDKDGRWTIVQSPNTLLSIWVVLTVIIMLLGDTSIRTSAQLLQNSVLFAWAYLELTNGDSYFRRFLGASILVAVILGYFI